MNRIDLYTRKPLGTTHIESYPEAGVQVKREVVSQLPIIFIKQTLNGHAKDEPRKGRTVR